jgi:hypothetical protein
VKVFGKIILVMLAMFAVFSLNAGEVDNSDRCDAEYDKCVEVCDKNEDGSEKCYIACEDKYEACLK